MAAKELTWGTMLDSSGEANPPTLVHSSYNAHWNSAPEWRDNLPRTGVPPIPDHSGGEFLQVRSSVR